MKAVYVIAVVLGAGASVATLPARSAPGQPVLGHEWVNADVGINTSGVLSQVTFQDVGPAATPFVVTRGFSNAVNGQPSNPVGGGFLAPALLDASNQLVPANAPLNLLKPADRQIWDQQSFAYALGNGPSFSVGAAAMAWNQQVYANYSYDFEHINLSGAVEVLSPISLHVDPGQLFLIPRFIAGESPSSYTALQASFSHNFRVEVADRSASGSWLVGEVKGRGSSVAVITLSGPQTFGIGQVLSFPPGFNDLAGGSIAVQNIPEQTLSLPQFDLLPGQRLSVSVSMGVSALAQGAGMAPIFYVLAGDPLSVSSGSAAPNVLLEFAPPAVPEPAAWLMMLAGLAGTAASLAWRRRQSIVCRTAQAGPCGRSEAPASRNGHAT